MSNASLLASVKRAIDEPQVRSGTDALHLPGPGGTWRLAQYARSKHNRTYWTIKVTSPHGATFHSFSSLSQHLDQLGGDDESDPMEEDEEVDAADGDAADGDAADGDAANDALRLRAAVHLQEVWCARRFRAACREVARELVRRGLPGVFFDELHMQRSKPDRINKGGYPHAPCVTCNSYHWCTPMDRRANLRELLWLQGIEDDVVFPVSDSAARRQIGNAMSCNVLRALFAKLPLG